MSNALTLWNETISALFNHFYYSIKDINSYEELTSEEKNIISKDVFDYLIRLRNNS